MLVWQLATRGLKPHIFALKLTLPRLLDSAVLCSFQTIRAHCSAPLIHSHSLTKVRLDNTLLRNIILHRLSEYCYQPELYQLCLRIQWFKLILSIYYPAILIGIQDELCLDSAVYRIFFHPADPRGVTQGVLAEIPTQLCHCGAKGVLDHRFRAPPA